MKNLLWCMGWPAAYFRRLHIEIDSLPGFTKKYIYYPYDSSLMNSRRYEEGPISSNAIVVDKNKQNEIKTIISKYLDDKDAVIIICGTYPRALLSIIQKLPKAKCSSFYCSDDNIYDEQPCSIFKKIYQTWIINSFTGLLQIGTANALYYSSLLGKQKLNRKILYPFPYPHFTDEVESNQKKNIHEGFIRFLYLGRIVSVKNVIAIVDGAAILVLRGISNFKVEISGDGECLNDIKAAINEKKLNAFFSFTGIIKSSQRKDIFQRNDVFILPSNKEPWGLVINEALSAGLPVITPYWTGAAVDLIVDGMNGVKLNGNDGESIANAMLVYCTKPEVFQQQLRHCTKWVVDHKFTHLTCLDTIKRICE